MSNELANTLTSAGVFCALGSGGSASGKQTTSGRLTPGRTDNHRQLYAAPRVGARSTRLAVVIAIATYGCGAAAPGPLRLEQNEARQPTAAVAASSQDRVPVNSSGRLAALWAQRSKDAFSPDFAVGPGDILEISVPDMEQLRDREARVSANGTIELPVVGVVEVAGLTEDQVKAALERCLTKYMRDPDVDVSVKEYNSREVAVVGMVQKPGLYTLASRSDTILDMISKAGGMTENASSKILFVPAAKDGALALQRRLKAPATPSTSATLAGAPAQSTGGSVRPASVESAEQPSQRAEPSHSPPLSGNDGTGPIPFALKQSNPIEIDLTSSRSSNDFVDLPARPGDVIIVPASGEVMVQGWVVNPGAFKITPGMTALGAVTAAGGEQFSSSATVLRTSAGGDKVQIPINLARIKDGEEPDIAVQSGDVVIVNRSAVGAVPYFVYSLFSKFGTGAYLPLPML